MSAIFLFTVALNLFGSNAQVVFRSQAATWADAQADCQSMGTDLLTAQGNPADIQECADATNAKVWTGLNKVNQNAWRWVAGDVTYDRNSVDWQGRGPASNAKSGNCVVLITNGRSEGKVTNKNLKCSDLKRYCCNPIPTTTTTTTTTPAPSNETCTRIRKEWNTMDQSERNLYINGMLALANSGKLNKFTEQHGQTEAEAQAHGTSGFLTWHRLFLWELEEQIRSLGGEYECFGLPYWNIGKDVQDHGFTYSDYSILNSGLGGAGDSGNRLCVIDGAFTEYAYTPYYCPTNWQSNAGNCCLRRNTLSDHPFQGWLYTNAEVADAVTQDNFYGRDDTTSNRGIRKNLELGPHGVAHCSIGGCSSFDGGHLGNGLYSPSDPIFYLLHGYVDMLYALWQDYNDYDLIDAADIGGRQYDGRLSNSGVDVPLVFDILVAESWSTLDGLDTSRDMHSIVDMGYSYDRGSFIGDGHFDETNLNDQWFVPDDPVTAQRKRRMSSESDSYEAIMYKRLKGRYGEDIAADAHETRRQIMETLATMSCEYMNVGDYECRRPKNFDDCSDLPLGPNQFNNHNDLNLTLDELIEKVKDYPCMVETRKFMFYWVAQLGGIWRLCRGDFDRFCDKKFLREENEDDPTLRVDQCIDKGYVRPDTLPIAKDNYLNHAQIVNNMDNMESEVSSTTYYLEGIAIVAFILILCGGTLYFRSYHKGNNKQNEYTLLNSMDNNKHQYSSI